MCTGKGRLGVVDFGKERVARVHEKGNVKCLKDACLDRQGGMTKKKEKKKKNM